MEETPNYRRQIPFDEDFTTGHDLTRSEQNNALNQVKNDLRGNRLSIEQITDLMNHVPREVMRRVVHKFSGLDASLIMTFRTQVQLVEAILGQLVDKDGMPLPASDYSADISLKQAMDLSLKVSQIMIRDLPKVYNMERIARIEQAIGDIMEEFMDPELQDKVLMRLEELTKEQS